MKLAGLLLDLRVLEMVRGIRMEIWDVNSGADALPRIWTAIRFQGDEGNAAMIAERLSQSLGPVRWYSRLSTENRVYVMLPNNVFKYLRGNR